MRICGRHIVLLALTSIALAGCGGDETFDGSNGGANLPPIIAGTPATTLSAGTPYTFTPTAADPDGDTLTFSATNVPGWATFNASTGALSGTPTEANVGETGMITIEVSDSRAVAQLPAFRINVSSNSTTPPPANRAPTIAGTPATTATVGVAYNFMPVGDDADDDNLTYSIQNGPTWATFTSATGQLSGTPTTANIGTSSNIIISVSDGTATTALPAFAVQVVAAPTTPPVNRPPTISGTPPATATAGTAYSFRPVASDPDGNALTWSIQNRPAWATFSTSTGRLNGTPTAADVGTSARITITVSDATASASLPSFTILVGGQANRPPVISGSPVTSLLALATYNFQPSASDPDGNPLTFSIANRPSWATFNTSTGVLSGTPALLDIGNFGNITISVSDGTAIASLQPFAIAVLQVANGSATVSWTAPTQNTDNSPLTNLSGYRIAYGNSPTNLNQVVTVTNPGLTSYTISNLSVGLWYFGVYAINSAGDSSDLSNVASQAVVL
jgi:hypothetical protein